MMVKKRNKVGRPRKMPSIEPAKVLGIVDTPMINRSKVELEIDVPQAIKKMLMFIKQMNGTDVTLFCKRDGIYIYPLDHVRKNTACIFINGRNSTRYFCNEEIELGLSQSRIEIMINAIDSQTSKVMIIVDENYRNSFKYITRDGVLDTDNVADISVVHVPNSPQYNNEYEYTLSCEFNSSDFKRVINTINNSGAKTFYICKYGINQPLLIKYTGQQDINHTRSFRNPEKIKLRTTVTKLFSIGTKYIYIKPILGCLTTNNHVRIDMNDKDNIQFTIDIEKIIHIKMWVELLRL